MLTCGCFSSKAKKDIRNDIKTCKMVFVGDSLSGKSALITSILHNQFNPNGTSTFGETSFSTTLTIDDRLVRKHKTIFFSLSFNMNNHIYRSV